MDLFSFDKETEKLSKRIAKYSVDRLKEDPPNL